jgi:hypothetical protein
MVVLVEPWVPVKCAIACADSTVTSGATPSAGAQPLDRGKVTISKDRGANDTDGLHGQIVYNIADLYEIGGRRAKWARSLVRLQFPN